MTRKEHIFLAVFISALTYSALSVSPGHCDDRVTAKTKLREGIELIKQENYPAALAAFEESYRLEPRPTALINIAMCLKALYRYVEAIDAFEQFVGDPTTVHKKKMRAMAKAALGELKKLTGQVSIEGAPKGTELKINGKVFGTTPFSNSLVLDPGRHSLELTKQGYEPFITEVNVTSGEQVTVRAALKKPMTPIRINCNSRDAVVKIDGKVVGGCPYTGKTEVGTHTIVIEAEGMETETRQVNAEPGARTQVDVDLVTKQALTSSDLQSGKLLEESDTDNAQEGAEPKTSKLLIAGYTSLGLGAVAGVLGGVFTGKMVSVFNEAESTYDQPDGSYNEKYEHYKDDFEKWQAAMIAGFAISGALLATGTILLIVNKNKKEQSGISVRPSAGGIDVRF